MPAKRTRTANKPQPQPAAARTTRRTRAATNSSIQSNEDAGKESSARIRPNKTSKKATDGHATEEIESSMEQPTREQKRRSAASTAPVAAPATEGESPSTGRTTTPRRQTPRQARLSMAPAQHQGAPASIQQMRTRIESTPLAGDTSVAALAHFRRRPRQPSLLHMVQNPDESFDTSELTLDTTVVSERSPVFAPHDESTPQPTTRAAPLANPLLLVPDPADDDLYTVSPRPHHGRKRKSEEISTLHANVDSEIEVMRSQTPSRMLVTTSSSLSDPRSSPSLPELGSESYASSTPRPIDNDSEVYADPLSSSPPTSAPASPAKKKAMSPRKRSTAATTALLRSLLPRRHNRQAEHEPSSDEEEVSEFMASKPPRKTKITSGRKVLGEVKGRRNPKVVSSSVPSGKTKSVTGVKRLPHSTTDKENAGAAVRTKRGTVTKATPTAGSRTYARRSTAAAEDEEEEEEDSGAEGEGSSGHELSAELKAARDKFRRIDQAELEFDSASLGGGGSSPWR